jgi:uncharacterized membrane protein
MIRKLSFVLFALFALGVGFYPSIYLFVDRKFGLLQSKSLAILSNISWNAAFYTHISLGGLALLIGWTQFIKKWRKKHLNFHRTVGKIYLGSVLLSALAGIYIAFFATGGLIPATGFIGLGIVWFFTTLKAYIEIINGRVTQHRRMMTYSYAACFAAVTLRIYLPILTALFHDFIAAYSLVAWLCWIPNLIVAYFISQKISKQKVQGAPKIQILSNKLASL